MDRESPTKQTLQLVVLSGKLNALQSTEEDGKKIDSMGALAVHLSNHSFIEGLIRTNSINAISHIITCDYRA